MGHPSQARPSPTSAGSAWIQKIRLDTVIAPKTPATTTHPRTKTVTCCGDARVGMEEPPPAGRPRETRCTGPGWRRASPIAARLLLRVSERLETDRARPEEHLEDQEPEVLDGHEHDDRRPARLQPFVLLAHADHVAHSASRRGSWARGPRRFPSRSFTSGKQSQQVWPRPCDTFPRNRGLLGPVPGRHASCQQRFSPFPNGGGGMTRKSLLIPAAGGGSARNWLVDTPAVSHDDDRDHRGRRRLKADLQRLQRGCSRSRRLPAGRSAPCSMRDETEISYRLDYRDLVGTVTQSHIHFGDHHMNGGISVWLCQTSTNPAARGTGPTHVRDPGGQCRRSRGRHHRGERDRPDRPGHRSRRVR